MLPLIPDPGQPLRILCLGAHCDDIEIGCGGALLSLLRRRPDASVRWVVLTSDSTRRAEAQASAADFLQGVTDRSTQIHDFPASYLPSRWDAVKAVVEGLKAFQPTLVLTHCLQDAHQDHRLVAELTWNTFRQQLVLEYEIPKYEADLGAPNVYVPIAPDLAERKIAAILRHFPSQAGRSWFTADTFQALLRLRGIHAASPTGLAEGFHGRKISLI